MQVVTFNEKALKLALIPQCGGNEQVANTVGNLIVKQLESFGVIKTIETEAPKAPETPKAKPANTERIEHLVSQLISELGVSGVAGLPVIAVRL
jgi:hypothetical protein